MQRICRFHFLIFLRASHLLTLFSYIFSLHLGYVVSGTPLIDRLGVYILSIDIVIDRYWLNVMQISTLNFPHKIH